MAKNKKESNDVSSNENVVVQVPVELDLPEVSVSESPIVSRSDELLVSENALKLFRYYQEAKRLAFVGDAPKMANVVYAILAEVDPTSMKWIFDGDDVKKFLSQFDFRMDYFIDETIQCREDHTKLFQ